MTTPLPFPADVFPDSLQEEALIRATRQRVEAVSKAQEWNTLLAELSIAAAQVTKRREAFQQLQRRRTSEEQNRIARERSVVAPTPISDTALATQREADQAVAIQYRFALRQYLDALSRVADSAGDAASMELLRTSAAELDDPTNLSRIADAIESSRLEAALPRVQEAVDQLNTSALEELNQDTASRNLVNFTTAQGLLERLPARQAAALNVSRPPAPETAAPGPAGTATPAAAPGAQSEVSAGETAFPPHPGSDNRVIPAGAEATRLRDNLFPGTGAMVGMGAAAFTAVAPGTVGGLLSGAAIGLAHSVGIPAAAATGAAAGIGAFLAPPLVAAALVYGAVKLVLPGLRKYRERQAHEIYVNNSLDTLEEGLESYRASTQTGRQEADAEIIARSKELTREFGVLVGVPSGRLDQLDINSARTYINLAVEKLEMDKAIGIHGTGPRNELALKKFREVRGWLQGRDETEVRVNQQIAALESNAAQLREAAGRPPTQPSSPSPATARGGGQLPPALAGFQSAARQSPRGVPVPGAPFTGATRTGQRTGRR